MADGEVGEAQIGAGPELRGITSRQHSPAPVEAA
jgi:hypothetical protein